MTGRSGVFLLKSDNTLEPMEPEEFVKENDFQTLLARFPELLVGDQIDPEHPRRWVLIRREQVVSTGETKASDWSVDHLFLDQDGIPTLVEVKRQSDSRIRREVVGQMLDYAANCLNGHSQVFAGLFQTGLHGLNAPTERAPSARTPLRFPTVPPR
jgi:hypothetical protein